MSLWPRTISAQCHLRVWRNDAVFFTVVRPEDGVARALGLGATLAASRRDDAYRQGGAGRAAAGDLSGIDWRRR